MLTLILFVTSPVFKPLRNNRVGRIIIILVAFGIESIFIFAATMHQSLDVLTLASGIFLIAMQVDPLVRLIREKPGKDRSSPIQ